MTTSSTFSMPSHFLLTLPDSAPMQVNTDFSSGFFVSVLDANLASALATTSTDATALAFTLEPGHAPMFQSFTNAGVVQIAEVSPVPEPATVALMLAGLVGIAGVRGKGTQRHHTARGSVDTRA